MDVDGLRIELERHLKGNPHEDAPSGFRDRFDVVVEQYRADDGEVPKSALEALLRQIANEAEAAVKAHAADPPPLVGARPPGGTAGDGRTDSDSGETGDSGKPGFVQRSSETAVAAEPGLVQRSSAAAIAAGPGFVQRYGVALVILVLVLVAAYLYVR